MSEFKKYRRIIIKEMRPYVKGENLSGVFVSENDDPENDMGMIARNPNDPNDLPDQYYVSRKHFDEDFEEIKL